jgi:filamentous hemagglutinin
MNRNCYRLVFNPALGALVPAAETARNKGKAASGATLAGVLLAGALWSGAAQAELPVARTSNFVTAGQAAYLVNGNQAYINQVGNKSILNWQSFNISRGNNVQFQQVDASNNLVQGASFTSLNRIWDSNPSVIAGSITQGAGQQANVILVNTNGIAFMGGSQVNLNQFTASSLNIKDTYVLDAFLPGGKTDPQFEKALDGSAARGFIKVFEGAQITAGNFGRVMLIAPTVVNRGTITAPDGQVILAAGSKVYLSVPSKAKPDDNLRGLLVEVDSPAGLTDFNTINSAVRDGQLDGQNVTLTNQDIARDKDHKPILDKDGKTIPINTFQDNLGNVSNLGELSSPRGNVTMIGYAVNQMGIARATTSVVSNGSVYLLAKDQVVSNLTQNINNAQRGGQVTLGAGSLTQVSPEVGDDTGAVDGAAGAGLEKTSQVQVLGQTIYMAGTRKETAPGAHDGAAGAAIDAPSGTVNMIAVNIPSAVGGGSVDDIYSGGNGTNVPVSTTARIHIASGASINVAGLNDVQVSAARNAVQVELRGDELKDSSINQQGPLRGETVYVNIEQALANANAGKPTLIAKDSLQSYQANLKRTVAERSTAGGTVNVQSQGEAIIESGAKIDLSGGSVKYTPALVKTTLLVTADGKLVDIANASADTRYDGISTHYVIDYGRWNKKQVIDLGQSYRYDSGYTEGKNAGALNVFGMRAMYMQADIQGHTTVGELQRNAGLSPTGASLTLGFDDVTTSRRNYDTSRATRDYKLNQNVELSNAAALLRADFKFGDPLPPELNNTLTVNAGLLAKDKVALLNVFSNQAVVVRDALRAPQGGGVSVTGSGVTVNADIQAASGSIKLAALNSVATAPANVADRRPDPQLTIADGVTLSTRGAWVNDLPTARNGNGALALVNGGNIALSAEVMGNAGLYVAQGGVTLGQNTLLDANGGGRVKADGTLVAGNGGAVSVSGFSVSGVDQNVQAYGLGKGGTISVTSKRIKIGGTVENLPGALQLDPAFFERGGFANFNLTALDTLTVADGTTIKPTVKNFQLKTAYRLAPSGSRIEDFSQIVKRDDRLRQVANLSLAAKQKDVGTGVLLIGQGARIDADPKATIAMEARNQIEILGSVTTAGGTISALLNPDTDGLWSSGVHSIWLGKDAVLDVSGKALTYTDSKGLTKGEVVAGGSVSLTAVNTGARTGYVVTEAGSRIDVSGAAPVRLDMPNESRGLGRMVGSDAGALSVSVEEGALLDGNVLARAGSASNRGGSFSLTLSKYAAPTLNYTQPNITLSLAQTVAPQATGLTPDTAIPNADVVRVRLGADKLEGAGFDRIALASRDAIQLEDGLNLGANRALPLREVKLDAARIRTVGGNAALAAETLRLGNYDPARLGGTSTATSTGALTLNGRQLELAGNMRLEGMARAELNGSESISLAGLTTGTARPSGALNATADLAFYGAVVAPTMFSAYTISAPLHAVSFSRNTDAPAQPLSALGSLTVKAKDIVQDGNLWAPFGKIAFEADESLTFKNGSLTSVAAAPGSLLPFGQVLNGRTWVYDVHSGGDDSTAGQLQQSELAAKSISVKGKAVDMQAGAKVNLAGGGDLQAYEFTVGPGGSHDILTDANTYAILPGFKGGVAPGDVQEAQGFNRAVGEAVYLSGVPGLANGTYTLLPAHYALLPGAFAVRLNSSQTVFPSQAYTRDDGVRVAAGYLTDSRVTAPKDANWSGIQVLTNEQVRARSEFTVTKASGLFAGGNNLPQDAGLLSIVTTGTDSNSLKLDALYNMAPSGAGRGGALDISAPALVINSGDFTGIDPAAIHLSAAKLNAMGASSVLLGGTRARSGSTTTLTVDANNVTLANHAAIGGAEIILAAKNTLTLEKGSVIDAQGAAGDSGAYTTAGNGALVRAASTTASFTRSGSPDGSKGTLIGEDGSLPVLPALVRAADSITLDATKDNAFTGVYEYGRNGNLTVGAPRINFGAAPAGAGGITYSQTALEALNRAKSLTLTSYTTFDLYGDVTIGGIADGKPTLQSLTLQGAGLAGLNNNGYTANLRAQSLTLANSASASFTPGVTAPSVTPSITLGTGSLAILADTLTLGEGDKKIQGYGNVTITANELVGTGSGVGANAGKTAKTDIAAPTTINVARISGGANSDQTLTSTGALKVASQTAAPALAAVNALGSKWALSGTSVEFNTQAVLPSGQFTLSATGGTATDNVTLGANAKVDVAGRSVTFFDVTKPTWGGNAQFTSATGNVNFISGALVDVSGAPGADGGVLKISAANGTVTLADSSVKGVAPVDDASGHRGDGAQVEVDTGTLTSFSTLNTALNTGGFDGARSLRVRSGDVTVAAGDTSRAKTIHIAADNGKINVAGTLDASGDSTGRIELFASNNVAVQSTAKLDAHSTGAGKDGGDIEIGTSAGNLTMVAGSTLNVSGGSGGVGGTVLLRAPRTGAGAGTGVAVSALASTVTGARSVSVEAVKVYNNINTLNATGTSSGTTLTLATINTDDTSFATNYSAIKTALGKTGDQLFHLLSGVEVRSSGDLTLGNGTATTDWNLSPLRAGGEPGVLTLRATGKLTINSNLSDGFSVATPCTAACPSPTSAITPATLQANNSWSYRLVAGADNASADPLAVKAGTSDVTLAAGKLIRTGTGDIRIASGRDIILADGKSAIYTAGRLADTVSGFVAPISILKAQFAQGGGDVSLTALGDISGKPSAQLYSDWLYRQGAIDETTGLYATTSSTSTEQPAWWVRFDQFQQGVGALGGGNVTLRAGGDVKDVSASTPTQGRMPATAPDASKLVVTGGGDVRISTGGDVLGGQYYADRGGLVIKAEGKVGHSNQILPGAAQGLDTLLALGDAQARVQARKDVTISNVIEPHLLPQSGTNTTGNLIAVGVGVTARRSLFSDYSASSGVDLQSLGGQVTLTNTSLRGVFTNIPTNISLGNLSLIYILPPNLSATAFQGSISVGTNGTDLMLSPAPNANLSLLAANSVNLNSVLSMSDRDPDPVKKKIPSPVSPISATTIPVLSVDLNAPKADDHAVTPVHTGDTTPARVYAVAGDVAGYYNSGDEAKYSALNLPKAGWVRAGRDVRDLVVLVQHTDATKVSHIEAGRDLLFSGVQRRNDSKIWVDGPGRLEVFAGRNINLGTSDGIVSRGNLDNSNLPSGGADIQLLAGAGAKGLDVSGTISRLIAKLAVGATTDEPTLWLARWLTGNNQLSAANALTEVSALAGQDAQTQSSRVRAMVFTALRTTGRDHNDTNSPFAGDYARGYAALELVFPGIGEKNPDGSFKNYQGDINIFASRIKTERGGNIEFMIPGGKLIVGLANTPNALVGTKDSHGIDINNGEKTDLKTHPLGMLVAAQGDIKGFARGDVLVNQSRILTVGGGDVLLWSSEGDIDAGKGKKTASAVPPPINSIDKDGNVTQVLQGAVSGSGIGALFSKGVTAGDVDLIAPKGTVNAGDAGIRAGNLNIAAQFVLGANNITASGTTSGLAVADTSAITATASGATSAGNDVSKTLADLNQSTTDTVKKAQALKDAFKPSYVNVEVLEIGN